MSNVSEAFGARLDSLGMSSAVAARRLGVTRSCVSHLRAGRMRPGLALAARIEDLTEIPAKAWVTPTEAPASDPAAPSGEATSTEAAA